ncbi:MAG: hypothetical protein AAF958_06910 [Planctomycetota bacterium]
MRFLTACLLAVVMTAAAQGQRILLVGKEVRIRGTANADRVFCENFGGDLVVVIENDTDFVFDVFLQSEVRNIDCELRAGDDDFDGSRCIVPANVFGGPGDDILVGTRRRDRILGAGGDDIIFGNTGADGISGGAGRDFINGGPHPDYVSGGNDRDIVIGGSGIDQVIGGAGQDLLIGGDFDEGEGNVGLASAIWFSGPDDDFEARVVAIFETGFSFFADAANDFMLGGDEADLFVTDADTVIIDGVGWPSGNSPPEQGDRVDAVFDVAE